jgi:hypothetical protein
MRTAPETAGSQHNGYLIQISYERSSARALQDDVHYDTLFPGSSAVEWTVVYRQVGGSNPSLGAIGVRTDAACALALPMLRLGRFHRVMPKAGI